MEEKINLSAFLKDLFNSVITLLVIINVPVNAICFTLLEVVEVLDVNYQEFKEDVDGVIKLLEEQIMFLPEQIRVLAKLILLPYLKNYKLSDKKEDLMFSIINSVDTVTIQKAKKCIKKFNLIEDYHNQPNILSSKCFFQFGHFCADLVF